MTRPAEPRRLFFCVTPLNILFAQAIRAREPGHDTLVFVPSTAGAKYQFYYDRFEWGRRISASIRHGALPDLAYETMKAIKVMTLLRERHFDELIFGNIGSLTFSLIAKRYANTPISTYDDGTLHADAEVHEEWLRQEPLTHHWFRRLTGACTNQEVLSRIQRHFTLFPAELCGLDVPEVIEIPLFADLPAPSPSSRPVRVLLGTPETKLVLGINATAYERLVGRLAPDIYLPHPRERRPAMLRVREEHVAKLGRAAQLLAAEDFIAELVKLGYSPSIEGFGSTALLNLSRQFATKSYYPAARAPQPIFCRLGVAVEPLEPMLR